jgi:hypothetical protein
MAEKKSNLLTCLLVGCGGMILLMAATMVGVYFYIENVVETYTQETPATFSSKEVTEADRLKLKGRLDSFKDKIESGDASSLILTEDDINTLISNAKELAGKVNVTIEGDQIKGQISVKLDDGIPLASGRYLNGEASFSVRIKNGELEAYVESVDVNGNPLPDRLMNEIKGKNLADDVKIDERTRKNLMRIERLEVKNGKIVLVVKEGEPMEKAPEEGGPDSETPDKKPEPTTK